jgi:hypothetical protein
MFAHLNAPPYDDIMLVVTTSISGSGRDEYLKKVVVFARKRRKKLKIYHVGDLIFLHAKKTGVRLTSENVLNTNPAVINAIRGAVFEQILAELPRARKEYDIVVINIHAMFFWKHVFQRTWDNYYVPQLKPDLFVTFLSDAVRVRDHLRERKQWQPMNVTTYDALLWSNVEVEVTAGWAEMMRRPHYVIPVAAPATLLGRLLFDHEKYETAYVSMPLTHGFSPAIQKKVNTLITHIEKHFIVFDPRHIELIIPDKGEGIDTALHHQIVNRDLYWLVRQADRVIAYFPEVVSSPGVINELREAYETNKEVWLIWPKDAPKSPFVTYYAHKVFDGPEEFLKFLKKKK